MAKKAELLTEAKKLKLEVSEKNTIAEIEAAIASVGTTAEPKAETKSTTAKSGKRSAKATAEVEEKIAKEERKQTTKETEAEAAERPKIIQKPARTTLERKSKKFQELAKLIEADKSYSLTEAIDLAIKTSPVAFDATVEMHVRLGVDPRQADQNLRDMVTLPSGTGKTLRVAVYADGEVAEAAKKAGADIAAGDEFLQQLEKGTIDFDILVTTPMNMAKLSKYARLLGPKGLMPNPKSGTVTTDVAKAVTESKAGRVEYRVDSTGIVHAGIGKVSFGSAKLLLNVNALVSSIKHNKPTSIKGNYVKSVYITTSMGPSIPVLISEI